ncbi:DUF2231 domain-containing protein [Rummeliibacillus sp. JY-2-4R]
MPLHPSIVHFPIALLILGAVIEIINIAVKKEMLNKLGTFLIVIGVLSGFAALASGDGAEHFAYNHLGRGIHNQIETHSFFATISMILFSVLAVIKLVFKHSMIKWRPKFVKDWFLATLIVILSIAGIASLATTGHLGGKIVYENQQTTATNTNKQ